MPVFAGLVTYLALSGTPGLPPGDYEKIPEQTARPDFGSLTGLALTGTTRPSWGTFAAKTESTSDAKFVHDTYLVRTQFGDVSAVEAKLTDTYRAVLSLSGFSGLGKLTTDAYVPVLRLGYAGLDKAGETLIGPVTDSYVPVLTLAVSASGLSYQQAGSDSYVPVLTFGSLASALEASDEAVLTDDYVPVLSMVTYLQTILAAVDRGVLDSYVPVLTFSPTILEAGDVDDIEITERPYGLIDLEET